MPGGTAAARHVLAPASSPSAGGVPSPRWGASRWVASALVLGTASLARNRPTGEGPTARRVARGAGVRRRHGYVVRPVARRAWVHALGCARPWASARPTLQEDYATARRPVVQSSGLGASPPCGTAARRGVFPRPCTKGCGVTPAPGVLAHWLGVAAARRLLCPPFHNIETTSLFARRRRRSGAQTAQEPHPSRHGSSAARRPAPRQEINSGRGRPLGVRVARLARPSHRASPPQRGVALLTRRRVQAKEERG
jgi:hypothetical protein